MNVFTKRQERGNSSYWFSFLVLFLLSQVLSSFVPFSSHLNLQVREGEEKNGFDFHFYFLFFTIRCLILLLKSVERKEDFFPFGRERKNYRTEPNRRGWRKTEESSRRELNRIFTWEGRGGKVARTVKRKKKKERNKETKEVREGEREEESWGGKRMNEGSRKKVNQNGMKKRMLNLSISQLAVMFVAGVRKSLPFSSSLTFYTSPTICIQTRRGNIELEDRRVERERGKQSRNGKRFHGKHVFIFCNPEASAF